MLGNPEKYILLSIAFIVSSLLWFLGLWLARDILFSALGYAMHAVTLLTIFVFLSACLVALVFRRFAQVRRELVEGRRVIAEWRVSPQELAGFQPVAEAEDDRDKRQALVVICFFIIVIFGCFAIYDREAALPMLAMAAAVIAAVTAAYLAGRRIMRHHLEYRSGEVIIGERGLMFNGVLHVWGLPLNWLADATLSEQPSMLAVTYAYLSRYGVQYVSVTLPVPNHSLDAARKAERGLKALLSARR